MIDLYPLETKAFIRQVPTFEWDRLVRQPARGLEKIRQLVALSQPLGRAGLWHCDRRRKGPLCAAIHQ
jgi:hypothetical protein